MPAAERACGRERGILRFGNLEARADQSGILSGPSHDSGADWLDPAARSGPGGAGSGRRPRRGEFGWSLPRGDQPLPLSRAWTVVAADGRELDQVSAVDCRARGTTTRRGAGVRRAAQFAGSRTGWTADRSTAGHPRPFRCRCRPADRRYLYRRSEDLVSLAGTGADASGFAGPLVATRLGQRHQFCRLSAVGRSDRRHQEAVRAVRPGSPLGHHLAILSRVPGRRKIGLGLRLSDGQSTTDGG